jgi:hypothetical protein
LVEVEVAVLQPLPDLHNLRLQLLGKRWHSLPKFPVCKPNKLLL